MMIPWMERADVAVLLFIQKYVRKDWMTGFWKAITFLGDGGWFWIVLTLAFLAVPKTRKIGMTAALALFLGILVNNVCLKNLVARVRPYDLYEFLIPLVHKQKDFSFPSGHTCIAFAAAVVFFRMLKKPWGTLLLVLAALIGLSRLYVGVHYPTDVLAGGFIGTLAAEAAYRIQKTLRTSHDLKGTGRKQDEKIE